MHNDLIKQAKKQDKQAFSKKIIKQKNVRGNKNKKNYTLYKTPKLPPIKL